MAASCSGVVEGPRGWAKIPPEAASGLMNEPPKVCAIAMALAMVSSRPVARVWATGTMEVP